MDKFFYRLNLHIKLSWWLTKSTSSQLVNWAGVHMHSLSVTKYGSEAVYQDTPGVCAHQHDCCSREISSFSSIHLKLFSNSFTS